MLHWRCFPLWGCIPNAALEMFSLMGMHSQCCIGDVLPYGDAFPMLHWRCFLPMLHWRCFLPMLHWRCFPLWGCIPNAALEMFSLMGMHSQCCIGDVFSQCCIGDVFSQCCIGDVFPYGDAFPMLHWRCFPLWGCIPNAALEMFSPNAALEMFSLMGMYSQCCIGDVFSQCCIGDVFPYGDVFPMLHWRCFPLWGGIPNAALEMFSPNAALEMFSPNAALEMFSLMAPGLRHLATSNFADFRLWAAGLRHLGLGTWRRAILGISGYGQLGLGTWA
jgi:hypothetical protein